MVDDPAPELRGRIYKNKISLIAMKLRFPVFFVIALVHFACSDPGNHPPGEQDNAVHKKVIQTKPPSSYSDTAQIDSPAAVFYTPDSLQWEKIKAVTDPGVFESTQHDCFYQMRYSRIVLKKLYPKVKIVEGLHARFLLFKKRNGSSEYIDLDKKNDACGIFLFDGQKSPRLADMPNIESELGFYFSSTR